MGHTNQANQPMGVRGECWVYKGVYRGYGHDLRQESLPTVRLRCFFVFWSSFEVPRVQKSPIAQHLSEHIKFVACSFSLRTPRRILRFIVTCWQMYRIVVWLSSYDYREFLCAARVSESLKRSIREAFPSLFGQVLGVRRRVFSSTRTHQSAVILI